jgi:hypothetical protein
MINRKRTLEEEIINDLLILSQDLPEIDFTDTSDPPYSKECLEQLDKGIEQ